MTLEERNALQEEERCSFDCGVTDSEQVVCLCPPGFRIKSDGRTCMQYKPGMTTNTNSNWFCLWVREAHHRNVIQDSISQMVTSKRFCLLAFEETKF